MPLTFANPLGLLGLLALPAILVVHMYHRRYPPLVVGGLHLWGAEVETRTAGRRRDRLPITPSLLLELLAALLLTLALARPVVGDWGATVHLVVVLDDSASMQSVPDDDGKSFRDLAVEELERRAKNLPRRSVLTVVLSGRRPVTLTEPLSDWETVSTALADWQPRATRHSFQSAWDLAAQLAGDSGRLLFLTDTLPRRAEKDVPATGDEVAEAESEEDAETESDADDRNPLPRAMEVVSVGRTLDNVAIAAAHWKLQPAGEDETAGYAGSVHLRIRNFGARPVRVTVRGTSSGAAVFAVKVDVGGRSTQPFSANVPAGTELLDIEIAAPGDPLELDNRVTLVEPKIRGLKVALTIPADDSAQRGMQRAFDAVREVSYVEADEADLVVAVASEEPPPVAPELWWLSVGPIDRSDGAKAKSLDLKGPYLIEKRHPLMTDVYLDGVIWGGAQPIAADVAPLASAGPHVLIGRRLDLETRTFLFNVDLGKPNVTDSLDWPKLVGNLAELVRDDRPGLRRWNYRLGEALRFRLYHTLSAARADLDAELRILGPKRTRVLPRTATIETSALDEAGLHEIRDGETLLDRFAVNFHSAEESDLSRLRGGTAAPSGEGTLADFERDDPFTWLLVLAVALATAAVLADWIVLKPRVAARGTGR